MQTCRRVLLAVALAFVGVHASVPTARATSMLPQNVVDLVALSERIMVGEVVTLTDGFDARGIPFTEVTLRVDDSIRGDNGSEYTFRQFGLLEPRDLGDGRTNLMVSPDGWPRFRQDEQVMVFLYQPASETGLQTTVGLLQGKFSIVKGQIVNAIGNQNVFHKVQIDASMLSATEERLTRAHENHDGMDAQAFVGLVKRAVAEEWVQRGRMIHAE